MNEKQICGERENCHGAARRAPSHTVAYRLPANRSLHSPLSTLHSRGFTLIEMLVVIILILILASSVIPIMAAASDARKIREGARVISAALSQAQARAVATGRSAGIIIQRNKNNFGMAMDVFMAESPPPYLGDNLGSTATVQTVGSTTMVSFPSTDVGWQSVRPGDLIRFNYRGQLYYIDPVHMLNPDPAHPYIQSSSIPIVSTENPSNNSSIASIPPPTTGAGGGIPFQVFRQPVKTAESPVQLTDGAVIDLALSGMYLKANANDSQTTDTFGSLTFQTAGGAKTTAGQFVGTSNFYADSRPIVITFSPTGALDLVYMMGQVFRPPSAIYLLIGYSSAIPIPNASNPGQLDPSATANFLAPNCRWVSIARQTGLVTVAEVGTVDPTVANAVTLSRRFAQGNQAMGGN